MSEPSHAATALKRYRITARGRVQGVGFRPTFYRALSKRGCAGSIRNTPEGVVLEVEGPRAVLRAFVHGFRQIAPPRARVDELVVEEIEPRGEQGFRIERSEGEGRSLLPIPPDLATCEECAEELRDAECRRGGYPFNTCTA
ncbi:MAG: acylphosphatase, partial [Planctomycetota bacterium]